MKGKVDPEERHGRQVQLLEPQDAPWTLDHDDWAGGTKSESVVMIQKLTLGKSWRKDPFPPVFRVQTPAGISKWPSTRIAQAHSDAAFEHPATIVGTDLETSSGLDMDSLVSKKPVVWIEFEASAIGLESGSRWYHSSRSSDRSVWPDDFEQRARHLAIVDLVEPTNQFDEIAATLAPCETVPEVSMTIDDKSGPIVTVVDRTGADELVTTTIKSIEEPAMKEETFDADALFEPVKVKFGTHHRRDRFPFDDEAPAGTLFPKVSK
jgi:hypothetical protein